MIKKILLIDNDHDFLESRAGQFDSNQFEVTKASSIDQAEAILNKSWVHVAIIDVRMRDDYDEKDVSGLNLAKNKNYRSVPKIILTRFPSYETVREALGAALDGLPPAVAFLAKQEGPQAMLSAVELAFEKHVKINWDLIIFWDGHGPISFTNLISSFEANLDESSFPERAIEIADLFRKLFYDYSQITISRTFWRREGRIALEVFTYTRDKAEQWIVTCGGVQDILDERKCFERLFLKTHTGISPETTSETLHYAATAWAAAKPVEDVRLFRAFFQEATEKVLRTSIENIYHLLSPLHQLSHQAESRDSTGQILREQLGVINQTPEVLKSKLRSLAEEASVKSLVSINYLPDQLVLKLPNGQQVAFPDPAVFLYDDSWLSQKRLTWGASPGDLDPDTILVDDEGQSWLTNYYRLTPVPILLDFISFENNIRFGLAGTSNLISLYDFERELISTISLSDGIPTGNVEPECRNALTAIQTIRKAAVERIGDDLLLYFSGLLFHAAREFRSYNPEQRRPKRDFLPLLHRLIFIGLLCQKIDDLRGESPTVTIETGKTGIHLDETKHEVRIDGRKITLTPTEYNLIRYLLQHDDQLCKRGDIVRDVFDYSGGDRELEESLLNTHIGRLRKKIEANSSKPRYLFTIRGEGYKLISHPE